LKHALRLNPRLPGAGLAVIMGALCCPFRLGVVFGQSMSPTLYPGELCLLDRSFYQRHPVQRGDIVLFVRGRDVMTKRVYGAPGDSLTLLRYLDDGTYEMPRNALDKFLRTYGPWSRYVRLVTLKLGPNECFVLGDNEPRSYDSRQFGPIATSAILGKLVTRLD